MNASYSGRPISEIAFSSRFAGVAPPSSAACSVTHARAWSGVIAERVNWLIVARLIGIGYTSPRYVVQTVWR